MATQSTSEDQKYAVFSPSTVQNFADSVGFDSLPEDILGRLSEDASYRIRELVSRSCEFMRCSRRKQLRSCDVAKALKWSNAKPIHAASKDLKFSSVEDVYYSDESILDLKKLAFVESVSIRQAPISLNTKWLPNNKLHQFSGERMDTDAADITDCNINKESVGFEGFYACLVECILSDNDSLFELLLNNIKTSPRIGPLVSYLTTFASVANLVSHDLSKLCKMLFVVRALLNNHYISIQMYLKPLLKAVTYCVLEPLAASINLLNDHWIVRDYGALLAAELVHSHASEKLALLDFVRSLIGDILSDNTRPLCSHYGALILTARLGKDSIQLFVLPMLANYLTTFVQPFLDDYSTDNTKSEAQMVFGACMFCIENLIYEADRQEPGLRISYVDMDKQIFDLFGDALSVRLPLHNFKYGVNSTTSKSKPDSTIPWQYYSLTTNIYNMTTLPKRRKITVADAFPLRPSLRPYRPIRIGFGLQKSNTKTRHLTENNSSSRFVAAHSKLQLVRRIVPVRKTKSYIGVMAWL